MKIMNFLKIFLEKWTKSVIFLKMKIFLSEWEEKSMQAKRFFKYGSRFCRRDAYSIPFAGKILQIFPFVQSFIDKLRTCQKFFSKISDASSSWRSDFPKSALAHSIFLRSSTYRKIYKINLENFWDVLTNRNFWPFWAKFLAFLDHFSTPQNVIFSW